MYLDPIESSLVRKLGNCGVGFAPLRPGSEDALVRLMEGVEDIPGTALHAGINWSWETFPEYLDALEKTPLAIDVGTQVPHGAVRAFVMGDRGPAREVATPEEIEAVVAQSQKRSAVYDILTNPSVVQVEVRA